MIQIAVLRETLHELRGSAILHDESATVTLTVTASLVFQPRYDDEVGDDEDEHQPDMAVMVPLALYLQMVHILLLIATTNVAHEDDDVTNERVTSVRPIMIVEMTRYVSTIAHATTNRYEEVSR